MKTTFVSTRAVSEAMRHTMLKLQSELVSAQKEVASGRLADVGASLGARTGQSVSLRQDFVRLNTIIDTNGLTASRLDTTQEAMSGIRETAQDFLQSLLSARSGKTGPQVVQPRAQSSLDSLVANLNATLGGQYLFAGINAEAKPIADYYSTPASAARQAVETAFTAAFGVPQTDPSVNAITPAAMANFLDTQFAALFAEPDWSADWSNASSENVKSRISSTELIDTSVNANEPAMKKLAMAYTMVADLGVAGLNEATFQMLADKAATIVGEAMQDMSTLHARIGTAQNRIELANTRMSLQLDILSTRITGLENVDPYEASTRVTALMTQIETSYALTARVQQLGILKYL